MSDEFEVGTEVQHNLRKEIRGTVVEVDGSTVYFETSTGVEMSFPTEQLHEYVEEPEPEPVDIPSVLGIGLMQRLAVASFLIDSGIARTMLLDHCDRIIAAHDGK